MNTKDKSFLPDTGLKKAIDLLGQTTLTPTELPEQFPSHGTIETDVLDMLAPHVLGRAAYLDNPGVLAHMDPPTPWITWATALWNARLNQNLLHTSTSPFAKEAEKKVIDWLTPYYGMEGGHMCAGSSIANLTALWAARDSKRIDKIVASKEAHISIAKAAKILGLPIELIATDTNGLIDSSKLGDLSSACLVLTAGITSTGVIDPLKLAGQAKWTHVDAAWGGPLRLSNTYAHLLDGIEQADSITISAHKWLFQPKDSALILFKNIDQANVAISFQGSYLQTPNIGVQGSRGAAAIPLLATMLAWGKDGFSQRIDQAMSMTNSLAEFLHSEEKMTLWNRPTTGVTVFRPTTTDVDDFYKKLPEDMLSTCVLDNKKWLRSVAANPMADINEIIAAIKLLL